MVEVGNEFDSWESLKHAVKAYALANQFSIKTESANKLRWIVRCQQDGCPFHLRAILSKKDSKCRITQLNPDHECLGQLSGKRGSHSHHEFLVDLVCLDS
jgi:hypothetical protein